MPTERVLGAYLNESGQGNLLLEDGSGVLLVDNEIATASNMAGVKEV